MSGALAGPNPLSLPALVSTLLGVTDIRRDGRAAPPGPGAPIPPREELTQMFIDVRTPEATALLAVIAMARHRLHRWKPSRAAIHG